jgi:DNA replication protein DnaC
MTSRNQNINQDGGMTMKSIFKLDESGFSLNDFFEYQATCDKCGQTETMITQEKSEEGKHVNYTCSTCYNNLVQDKKNQELRERRTRDFQEAIPKRYHEAVESADTALYDAHSTILWGSVGIGKTWRVFSMLKWAMMQGKISSIMFDTQMGLTLKIKDFENQARIVSKCKAVDFLVLDEFGKMNNSDFNAAAIFDILNYRYDNMKKTILICNANSKDDIRGMFPPALLDRFRENVIEMRGKSRRYE